MMHVFSDFSSDSVKLNENESVKLSVSLKCILNANSDIKPTVISALKIHLKFNSDDDVISLMRCCINVFNFRFMISSDVLQYSLMIMLKFFIILYKMNLFIS